MRVPSIQALRALDSFARHGSVWKTAEELNLTRSAVSHQLRQLERDVGFVLFNRVGTKLELSDRGYWYAMDVRKALTSLIGAAQKHGNRGVGGRVTVSSTPGFASSWLCAHINEFHSMHPNINISITTPVRLDDVSNPQVDVFVAFGDGKWSGNRVERLANIRFTPLCCPVFMNKGHGLSDYSDLSQFTLLHLIDYNDWEDWYKAAGLDPAGARRGIVFSDMNLVYSAMTAAQGIAMGDEFVCGSALDAGQLIKPFDLSVAAADHYHLVVSDQKTENEAVNAFCDWVKAEMQKDQDYAEK